VLRERLRGYADGPRVQKTLMATYGSMLELKIAPRWAASFRGISRTTANRKPAPPVNKRIATESAGILAAGCSP
jgi:putative transposase